MTSPAAKPAFILYDNSRAEVVAFDATASDVPALAGLWVEVTALAEGFSLAFCEADRIYGKRFRPSLLDDVLRPVVAAAIDEDDFSKFRSLDGSQRVADFDKFGRYR